MIIEISIASIALTLLVWMICFVIFLSKTSKTLEAAKRDIHNISLQVTELMGKVDTLVSDIQSKSDSLDVVFRPLKFITKGKRTQAGSETLSEVLEWVGTSLTLFNKIKSAVKSRGK